MCYDNMFENMFVINIYKAERPAGTHLLVHIKQSGLQEHDSTPMARFAGRAADGELIQLPDPRHGVQVPHGAHH